MSKKQNTIVKYAWTEEDIEKSLHEIAAGKSIRSTASKYGMSESMLRSRIKKKKAGKELMQPGRKTTFSTVEEKQLAKCIGSMCRLGFSPTRSQIKDMVKDYVLLHNLKTPFKEGRPGKDWLCGFMDRNHLSMKKANMISSARKSSTSNPFIIYDFYDVLEKVVEEKKLEPHQIWNCDESGFPTDPQKCKVVSVKGEVAYKVTCGAGRENTTTLAVCSAAGRVLDPLIVFSGKNLQSSWGGDKALPNTYYGISENGWMTTELFAEWFELFTKEVTDRPLLLLLDGHLTHVSILVLELAVKEDITIIKFPPHVTDKLQPLDVACFGPLKREWKKLLNNHISTVGPKQIMRKATFVDMLCEVWHKGLSPENAKAGFHATGIYPVDRTKFPVDRIDARLLRRFNQWVALGKPEDLMEDLATSVHTPSKVKPSESSIVTVEVIDATPMPSANVSLDNDTTLAITAITAAVEQLSSPPVTEVCHCLNCVELGPVPVTIPGKGWVPVWSLQRQDTAMAKPTSNKSFDELLLDKMKGPTNKPAAKRKRCDKSCYR